MMVELSLRDPVKTQGSDFIRRLAMKLAKKERVPRKSAMRSSKGHERAMNQKQTPAVEDRQDDSEAIERAVYDGMRDLREEKSK